MEKKGFALIELLVVVGILGVIIGAIIVAVNPLKQFAQANNAKRRADLMNIMNAISQNIVDNNGTFTTTTNCLNSIPEDATTTISSTAYNICGCIVPDYIGALAVDPSEGSPAGDVSNCGITYDTGYQIIATGTPKRITLIAPYAQSENGSAPEIRLTR